LLVRLEMDAKLMNFPTFSGQPPWTMILILTGYLTAGIALGMLYFRGLWWNARLFAGASHLTASVALMIGRFVILAGFLTLASLEGVLPLLVMALGILVARAGVMRRARSASS
jgi:F1F0 ATPase subunit 2